MAYTMERSERLTVGTEPKKVSVDYRSFVLVNTSMKAAVYFRECAADGKAATKENSFALMPGESLQHPLTAKTLSMMSAAEDVEVCILYLREDG